MSIRAYLRSSRMDFLQHFLLGQPLEDNGQDSGGLMLSLVDGAFGGGELMLGMDMDFAASTLLQEQDGPTTDGPPDGNAIRPAGRHYDYTVDPRFWPPGALAPAACAALVAGDRTAPGAGALRLRQPDDRRQHRRKRSSLPRRLPVLAAGRSQRRFHRVRAARRIGLAAARAAAAWLSLARGFRAPEATELYRLQRQQSVAELDAERIDALELGLRLRGTTASLDLAAFRMDKHDVILRDSAGFNVTGGRTRHLGIEYEAAWTFHADWTLSGSGTVADHEYRFTAAVEQGEQITAGNAVDTAPRQVHALRLRRDGGLLAGELEWLHVGRYWTNAANTARYDGHDLANLRVSARAGAGWSLTARVTNLLDDAYADRADFAFGDHRYFPGRDRAYFVELDWRED